MSKLSLAGLGEPIRKKGNQVFFNCPFHEDTHGHLGVNLQKKVFHCFKCNVSGRLNELETPLNNFKEKVERYLYGDPDTGMATTPQLHLPREYKQASEQSGIPYRYLIQRELTKQEIDKYHLGYCSEGEFIDRIIIPVYTEGKLTYFMGRSYTNRAPKYMNAPIPKAGNVFKTFTKRQNKAIICEGAFDAIRIGRLFPAIALLGKVLNGSEQIISIMKSTKEAYVMLDRDAESEGFKTSCILNYYLSTKVMFIKDKDPGSMSMKELKRMLP